MRICEDMSGLVCGTNTFKCDNLKLKRELYSNRVCMLCGLGIEEHATHTVMQCPYHEKTRINMYESIVNLIMEISDKLHNLQGEEKFVTLMGTNITDTNPGDMAKLWCVSGSYISEIYRITITKHAEYS